jgi:hypothetical protein
VQAFGCLWPERIAAHQGVAVQQCFLSALYAAIHKLAAHAISCSTGVNERRRTSW